MSESDLNDFPEAFGHSIFCDDIRDEVGGKKSFMGVYKGTMFIHDCFPILLPKFGFSITLFQKRAAFVPNVVFQIFLPGDTSPSILMEATENEPGAALEEVAKHVAPNDVGKPPGPLVRIDSGFVASPLVLRQEGDILVRAIVTEKSIRLGRLRVRLSKTGIERTAAAAQNSAPDQKPE